LRIDLLQHSSLDIVIASIRKCYESEDKGDYLGHKDMALIRRVIESGHTSTIEHCFFTFNIDGVSRGLLQELARHRHASLSVKSTRYTLGKIKAVETPFTAGGVHSDEWKNYLVESGNEFVDYNSRVQLEEVRHGALGGIPNDQLKYMLPESFKTSLIWTINARSLRNFLQLRLSPRAHWEIRSIANSIFDLVPFTHKVLIEDITA